jgi:hypothetical protein
MAFNPNDHMMKLKGKDYLQVAWRLVWFREDHPDWCIDTVPLTMDADSAVFKATICDENGVQKCAGHGSESKRDFGDFIEKAETKAVGRALAMLGYGTQFTATEFDEGERIVDSPIDRAPRGSAEAAQEAGQKKLEELNRQMAEAAQVPAERPMKGPATDEQKKIIKEKADDETYLKAMQAFGADLENMTKAQANKLIARIKEAGAA